MFHDLMALRDTQIYANVDSKLRLQPFGLTPRATVENAGHLFV